MPELPEVETVCRGLNQVSLHQSITNSQIFLDRTIAYPNSPTAFQQGLLGAEIQQWQRRGKYLLAKLQRDRTSAGWLGVHLRMTGQLLWVPPETPLSMHCRVRFTVAGSDQELRFVDQRTFGRMWWVPPPQSPEHIITTLQTLGVEPLTADFSAGYLYQRLKHRDRPIKNALLDQAVIAGIGNIYADESLFLSHIHPLTPGSALKSAQVEALQQAIVAVLTTSIAAGGTTFSDFQNVYGINGNYSGQAWVYGRKDQPCRLCSTPIERLKLAGRSAHYCPQCQPRPRQRRRSRST